MIETAPIRSLKLSTEIASTLKQLPPHTYIKGGVAREALLTYFSRYDRTPSPPRDYDYIVFVKEDELVPEGTELLPDGDVEYYDGTIRQYMASRDNSLNEVLLDKTGLYFSSRARRDACSLSLSQGPLDSRPRAVLRNVLLAVRTHHTYQGDVKEALRNSTLIDEIIPLLKAYTLGVEYEYFRALYPHNSLIRKDGDPDLYMMRLLREWEKERWRPFEPFSPTEAKTLKEIKDRNYDYSNLQDLEIRVARLELSQPLP